MTQNMIDVASEFSPYPSGRVPNDGTFNGERFRKEVLVPALSAAIEQGPNQRLVIDIDGVRSFGSSFLEEAFGGLIRTGAFTQADLLRHLEIRCHKPHLQFFKEMIESYIKQARPVIQPH
ncbi:STAS-like domain-containing protein [Mesorhizobium sp.]|uniref:STAS-like domain-containing protein n=1 Tax=Mesorhizobium sp. TaxID=1871066 RepID=UPI003BA8E8CD